MDFVIEKRDFQPGILEKVRKASKLNRNLKDAYIIFRTALLLEECELSAYFFLQFLYYMANKPADSYAIKIIDDIFKKMNSNHFLLPEEGELWNKAKAFAIESTSEDVLSCYEAIAPDVLKPIRVRQYTWEGAQMTINNHQDKVDLLKEFHYSIQELMRRRKDEEVQKWLLSQNYYDIEMESTCAFFVKLHDSLRMEIPLYGYYAEDKSQRRKLLYWYLLKEEKSEPFSSFARIQEDTMLILPIGLSIKP